jgi:hypothetical protein
MGGPHGRAVALRLLFWPNRARATKSYARVLQMFLVTPELNWAGQPIRPGEVYGGTPLHMRKTEQSVQVEAKQKKHHYQVITEADVAEVFGHGAYTLARLEATKLLEARTGAHWTSCYRALRPKGPFAQHLYSNGKMLS